MKKVLLAILAVTAFGSTSNAETYTNSKATLVVDGTMATIETVGGTETFDITKINEECMMLISHTGISSNIYCLTKKGIGPIFLASEGDNLVFSN